MSTAERILDVLAEPADSPEVRDDAPATPRSPLVRTLTPEVRKRIGLPAVRVSPFNWPIALAIVGMLVVLLLLIGKFVFAALAAVVGLVVFPLVRSIEARDVRRRELLFLEGREAVGRVVDVEPAGGSRNDHVVRIEYFADATKLQAAIVGAPLARRGLAPGEDVVLVYDPADPIRCLLVDRIVRDRPIRKRPAPMEPEGGAHACGCGKGGCGN